MGLGPFAGVNSGRGVTLTPHPLLVTWSRQSRAIPLLPLWAARPVQNLSVCIRMHFNVRFTKIPTSGVATKPHYIKMYFQVFMSSKMANIDPGLCRIK